MTQKSVLHILNGQLMYDFFKKENLLKEELMVPFNEAMCYGETCFEIFSDDFIEIRANLHHVTPNQYYEITIKPLQSFLRQNFAKLILWFDSDMFCQINILTILAWLDQINYQDTIDLHIVGDDFELKQHIILKAEGYYSIYKQVVIQKMYPDFSLPEPLKKGVQLYLNYSKEDNDLCQYIQKSGDLSEKVLVTKLIGEFKEYGLGDVQYLEMIRSIREK